MQSTLFVVNRWDTNRNGIVKRGKKSAQNGRGGNIDVLRNDVTQRKREGERERESVVLSKQERQNYDDTKCSQKCLQDFLNYIYTYLYILMV